MRHSPTRGPHAVIDVLREERLRARVEAIGRQLNTEFHRMANTSVLEGLIGDVPPARCDGRSGAGRGRRLRPAGRDPRQALVGDCARSGVVILPCGTRGNVVRFLLPLTGPDALIGEGLGIMETALVELVQAKAH